MNKKSILLLLFLILLASLTLSLTREEKNSLWGNATLQLGFGHSVLQENSSFGATCTAVGDPTLELKDTGLGNQSLKFDGDDAINCPASPQYLSMVNTTVDFGINHSGATGTETIYISHHQPGTAGHFAFYDNGGNPPIFYFQFRGASTNAQASYTCNECVGFTGIVNWTLIKNVTDNTVCVYILKDGKHVGADNCQTYGGEVNIGWQFGSNIVGDTYDLTGEMHYITILNRTLTSDQVAELINEDGNKELIQLGDEPPPPDITAPVFVDAGCKSCSPYQNYLTIPWLTDDTTTTYNLTTDGIDTCAVMGNETGFNDYNYTDMMANGGDECTTTGASQHICTISTNPFTLGSAKNVSFGCKDDSGNEALNAIFSAPAGIYTFGTQCVSDCIKPTAGCGLYLESGCTTLR